MRIFKFMKKNILSTLLLILLLAGQAVCLVQLPEYISKIVDVGIRNKGIEYAVPLRIRESEKEKTKFFLQDQSVWDNYRVEEINGKKVYVLKENVDIDSLNYTFARALIGVKLINKGDELQHRDISINLFKGIKTNFNIKLMKMSTQEIIDTLEKMPQNDLKIVNDVIDEKLELVTEEEMVQIVSDYLADEYEICGIGKPQKKYITRAIVEMLLISIALFVIDLLQVYVINVYSTKLSEEMRNEMFEAIVTEKGTSKNTHSVPSLINRTVHDTQVIEKTLHSLMMLSAYLPIFLIGTYFKVKKLSHSFETLLPALVLIGGSIGTFAYLLLIPKNKRKQKVLDKINAITRESLNNLFVIRNTGKNKQVKKFDTINNEYIDINTNIWEFKYLISIFIMFLANLVGTYVLWQGGIKIDEGAIGIGALMAVLDYLFQMSFICSSILKRLAEAVLGYVSYKRYKEVFSKEKKTNQEYIKIDNISSIEFKDVCFKYENESEYTLNKFSLKISPKEKILLRGKTGTGKSTLIKLLLKLYKIESGEILINGINIDNIDDESIRSKIGAVMQQNDMFYGTARYNILLGNTVSDEQLNKAVNIAEIFELVSDDKNIGYKGKNISGGQKQRLAIARAIVSNPDVLVLDNAYTYLDEKTTHSIKEKITKEFEEKIIITIEKEMDAQLKNVRIVEM